jgi:hypothetical protein
MKKKRQINYQVFLFVGLTFIGAGVVFLAAVNEIVGASLIVLGASYMVIGGKNKDKWKNKKENQK